MIKESNRFKNIIFYRGIGDFLAVDCLLSGYEKKTMKNFLTVEFFPRCKCKIIIDLIKKSKKYNPFLNFIIINKNNLDAEKNKSHFVDLYGKNWIDFVFSDYISNKKTFCGFCNNVKNFKSSELFGKVVKNRHEINSSFLNKNFEDILKFNLPNRYAIIVSYTSERNNFLDLEDWHQTIKILKKLDIIGVVIGEYNFCIPNSSQIINLCGKTNIFESFTLINNCEYYIGIDSFASVLASYRLQSNNFFVKAKCKTSNTILNFNVWYPLICKSRISTNIKYCNFFDNQSKKIKI